MNIPDAETIRISAISHLRELGTSEAADVLSRCRIEIGGTAQRYSNSTALGLNITLRCRASDLVEFTDQELPFEMPSQLHMSIETAIQAVLPAQLKVHELSARSFLVDRTEFEKSELERMIEAQMDVMIAVATGGPRIQSKNDEYRERREAIREMLRVSQKADPNPFEDLWAWYGRWRSGDLPTYQSRREYVRALYRPLLEELAGGPPRNPAEPSREPTGWDRVDRIVDRIISSLAQASREEEYQTVGLLCRECFISLAQAVFDPARHVSSDGVTPSETDAYRMLEAYFSAEYTGAENEALRRHAKASLSLANQLQHKRTAMYKDAALCSEATRTVVNIVAITSGRR
ncbi:MAG: hypothetical protein ACE141_18290 [Bryobacteraceae bacterium]